MQPVKTEHKPHREGLFRWSVSVLFAVAALFLLFCLIQQTDLGNQPASPRIVELDYLVIPNMREEKIQKPQKKKTNREPRKKEPEKTVLKQETVKNPAGRQSEPRDISSRPQPDSSFESVASSTGKAGGSEPLPVETADRAVTVTGAAQLDNVSFQPLFNPPPRYPEIARNGGIEGFADVELIIDSDGRIESYTVKRLSGHPSFGTETAAVIPRWRFPPPRKNGKAIRVRYVYRVWFRLDE